jgi:uncharacterized cupin superfamily protein
MTASITNPAWAPDPGRDTPPGFGARRAFVGRAAGCRRLGATLWELPAGQAAYPYHFHLVEEEMVVVLAGHGRLRTPGGWRDLSEGDLLAFPAGEEGGHQIVAGPDGPLRFLAVSTSGQPDVCVYPDSAKVAVTERRGGPPGGLRAVFRLGDAVDYWHGEGTPPSSR